MMKISLATNFDNNLIDELKGYPIYEVYGKLKHDIMGGGRPDNTLSDVSKELLESHVKKVRDAGFDIDYVDVTVIAQYPKLSPLRIFVKCHRCCSNANPQ